MSERCRRTFCGSDDDVRVFKLDITLQLGEKERNEDCIWWSNICISCYNYYHRIRCGSKKEFLINKKNSTMTVKALDPYSGCLRCRLDHNLNHLPIKNDKPKNNCQLHYWANKQKVRAQLMKCGTCNVTLCITCYKIFHEVAQLKTNKVKWKFINRHFWYDINFCIFTRF